MRLSTVFHPSPAILLRAVQDLGRHGIFPLPDSLIGLFHLLLEFFGRWRFKQFNMRCDRCFNLFSEVGLESKISQLLLLIGGSRLKLFKLKSFGRRSRLQAVMMRLNDCGRFLLKIHGFCGLNRQSALFLLLSCQGSRCVALKWNVSNGINLMIRHDWIIEVIDALLFRFGSGEFDLWHRWRLLVILVALEELEQVALR